MKGYVLIAVAGLTSAASGQTSKLYMSNWAEGGSQIFVVQGGTLVNTFKRQDSSSEGGMAIAGDIRTVGVFGTSQGFQYDLSGGYTGTMYTDTSYQYRYDGTTDGGKFNYACDYATGQVTRSNRDWTGSSTIFSAGGNALGMAYDQTDGTLWMSNLSTGTIQHYQTDGTLIGQFGYSGGSYALALDPADGTLWAPGYFEGGTLYQYSKSGTLLQRVSVSGLGSAGILAAEFDQGIPAPGAVALLGLGGLAASGRRRGN